MGGSGEHKGPYPVRTGRRRKALNCNPEIDISWEERIMRTSKLLLLAASVSALSVSTPGFAFQADGQEPATQDAATDDRPQSGGVEDIVVPARRVSESVQKVTLAITVVGRSEEQKSELQSIMRNSYAVFSL